MTRASDTFEVSREPVESRQRSADRMSPLASTSEASADLKHLGNQQVQALHRAGKLHPSVEVGRSDDVHEREADRMADQALQMETPSANGEPSGDGPRIRRKSESASSAPVSDGLVSSLGKGKPLDSADRSHFEPRFGVGLDDVRVHTGPDASRSAAAIHASAYTLGSNVVFGEGRYQPGTTDGRRLLAHELAHVAQESGAKPVIRRQPAPAKPAETPPPPGPDADKPQGNPDAGPAESARNETGVVKEGGAELYDRAGHKQEVLERLAAKTTVQVTGDAGSWYKVRAPSGKAGYVLHSKVQIGTAEKKPEDEKPEEKKPADPYQGIIDKSLKNLTTDDGEPFYHLDATFGNKLFDAGSNRENPGLLPGMGDKTGWLRQHVSPCFKQVGYKTGDQLYAMVIHKGVHFLARTDKHKHTVIDGKKIPADKPDAVEGYRIFPDWEKRMAAADEAAAKKKK